MKTTRITVEIETLMIVRRAKLGPAWCLQCRAEVEVITLDRDSLAEQVASEQLQEWLGTVRLHSWRTADGAAQFCVNSLLQCLELDSAQRLCSFTENRTDPSRRKQK